MKKYVPTIGLEIHVVLNTNTKMFSPSKSVHNDGVNNHINEIDLALPGAMPSLNEEAVKKGLILAKALNMKINATPLVFDRKNYYYWDLPKGFQITQQFNPIGQDGYLILDDNNSTKINIERIQLEEDTAKQLKIANSNDLLLNYNRAGMPLIEIVSKPVLHSSKEIELYLNGLREIFIFMNISDAKMEDGSMRVDVNISLSEENSNALGTKVEVKNINSINNAVLAAEYEIKRQSEILNNNQTVKQETRRFDDSSNTTIFMREKSDSVDYRYMTEPNILAINTPIGFIQEVLSNMPISPYLIRKELRNNKIPEKDISLLMSNKLIYDLFIKTYQVNNDYKDSIRWILNELMGILNKKNISIEELKTKQIDDLFLFLNDYKDNKFNSKQAKDLFNKIFLDELDYQDELTKLLESTVVYSEFEILNMINDILAKNLNIKQELITRYEKAEKFIIGSLMKLTKGQINPLIVTKLLSTLEDKLKEKKWRYLKYIYYINIFKDKQKNNHFRSDYFFFVCSNT